MTEANLTYPRVLAIDPTSRGFAYAVLEGPASLIDWGLTQVEGRKHSNCLLRLEKLIERYAPDILVLEDYLGAGSRRCGRVRKVIQAAALVAKRREVRTRRFSRRTIRRAIAGTDTATKQAIAAKLAERFPELAPRLPRVRKPWMSEDERMSIFDAAALALVYYGVRPQPQAPLAEAA